MKKTFRGSRTWSCRVPPQSWNLVIPERRTGANITSGTKNNLFGCIGNAAERTENLRLRELKLFFFEFHAWYYWLHWDPQFLNERLFVDDTVSRLFGRYFPSIKNIPENAVKSVCFAKGKRIYIYIRLKVAIWKQHLFVNFVPQNQVYILDYAFRSRYHTKIDFYVIYIYV